jgi:transposase
VFQSTGSQIAGEALERIRDIHLVEAAIRRQPPPFLLAARRQHARPLVDDLRLWLDRQLPQVPGRSGLAEAIRYAIARWAGLKRFLDDGRVELDTNPVERAIRPVALGRKTHLFAGSDGGGHRWGVICSLIETCKLDDVEPYAYLTDVLQHMIDGHPVNRLDDLLPWTWKADHPVNP